MKLEMKKVEKKVTFNSVEIGQEFQFEPLGKLRYKKLENGFYKFGSFNIEINVFNISQKFYSQITDIGVANCIIDAVDEIVERNVGELLVGDKFVLSTGTRDLDDCQFKNYYIVIGRKTVYENFSFVEKSYCHSNRNNIEFSFNLGTKVIKVID